jgi:4-alpha-glucanotransferase
VKIHFYLRYHTHDGQCLLLSGETGYLGNCDYSKAIPMQYLNQECWHVVVEIPYKLMDDVIHYKYLLKNEDGEIMSEWGFDKYISKPAKNLRELILFDRWNRPGEYENVFYTVPFRNALLKRKDGNENAEEPKRVTHVFRVKAPLLLPDETVCILGSGNELDAWSTDEPQLMRKYGDWFELKLNLSKEEYPVEYKYGVYNTTENSFVKFEAGNNRVLYCCPPKKRQATLHDGFVHLPNTTWKGAGIAIPVFSLRSKKSSGVGEFTDIKALADWAAGTGIKLIQLLPVNDTIATYTAKDSYPYAAVSVYALHPIYINLSKIAGKKHAAVVKPHLKKLKELNALPVLDYEQVVNLKLNVLKELYKLMRGECFDSVKFKQFLNENRHWLVPYAAFCYLRDKYGTPDFTTWEYSSIYHKEEVEQLSTPDSEAYTDIAFHYFVQYHLHYQLKEMRVYAHKKGVVLKGDLPIGVNRFSCEVWTSPELFDMNNQLGAPPDDFSDKGQNWLFPAYNRKKMEATDFGWWKNRLQHFSKYFDAYRIDHILGFFRTWNIPDHAVEGIMGRFEPAVPVHVSELKDNGIWPDFHRLCSPFINDEILQEIFGHLSEKVKDEFLVKNKTGGYDLLPAFQTQRQVEKYYSASEMNEESETIKQGLFALISNVILFEEDGSHGKYFHFRIGMERTSSFRHMIPYLQDKLRQLYYNYFYKRQDELWKKEALKQLSSLKDATGMLIFGEDLGMVPYTVPEVMQQLGILSLEIQRMPKKTGIEFFHPDDAPYLSVVSPGTHDMSTIRGWWEENPVQSQRFYNNILGQRGEAPKSCEAWINRAIILQHLYSPAMWSIFQLQDILGMSETLRRDHPHEERINVPANSSQTWNYRMHLNLEELIKAKDFNEELKGYVINSGR